MHGRDRIDVDLGALVPEPAVVACLAGGADSGREAGDADKDMASQLRR
jgi:hypothetical protein